MRAVVQRVASAEVVVDGRSIAAIRAGLLVYLAVGSDDDQRQAALMADKVRHLRIFQDDEGKMNRDVAEAAGAVLVVSNFSLYGDARKGRRPSYIAAAPPRQAEKLYEHFCDLLAATGVPVQRGRFQATMAVESVNDGPINLLLDSNRTF